MNFIEVFEQMGWSAIYYFGLVLMVRLAGKRLAGQTTTFDLLILISLGVTIQNIALVDKGRLAALVFVLTVFGLHVGLARLSSRVAWVRRVLRGTPTTLLKDGKFLPDALQKEGLSEAEARAALRKLGHASPEELCQAVLEETGHISAIPSDKGKVDPV